MGPTKSLAFCPWFSRAGLPCVHHGILPFWWLFARCDLGLLESRDAAQLIDGHVSGKVNGGLWKMSLS